MLMTVESAQNSVLGKNLGTKNILFHINVILNGVHRVSWQAVKSIDIILVFGNKLLQAECV